MKKTLFLLPILALLIAGCASTPPIDNQSTGNSAVNTSQKFSDQNYYSRSYLISADTLSPQAQKALAGFSLDKKTLLDGTIQITLKALQPEYRDQQYVLKPGEQLYFIETSMGDDQGGLEANIFDDSAVIVDSQGNVVGPPKDWSK